MSKKLQKYIDEALKNVRDDRKVTKELLEDAIGWLSKDEARHKEVGVVLIWKIFIVRLQAILIRRLMNNGFSKFKNSII